MTVFRDFNFKLLVVEKLMYWDETLTPAFSLEEHLRTTKGFTGDLQLHAFDNGLAFTVFDEARDFFERLEIGGELLATVDTLTLDGGHQVYMECAPVWDGEDDLFDVRSLDDLDLLPNLRLIDGGATDMLDVPGKHEIAAARGITLT
ncbi:DUF6892 domain-containing protein [Streptomyces desertarenae]|uniref:DUF6892 domain-containing protein n=1 Tax=Streptomyces desertarenae TaxID=2666184 RepID=A0ABW4PP11_9ACTN